MNRTFFRTGLLAVSGMAILAVVLGVVSSMAAPACAEVFRHSTPDDLFYNYYVPPVGPGSVGAQMYVCPRPTPPLVGHTYVTYQPLLPHESLYRHHRYYRTQHDDAPVTRTSVHWR